MANRYTTYSPGYVKFLLLHLATFGAGRLQEGPIVNGCNEQRTLVGGKNGMPNGAKGGVCLFLLSPRGRSADSKPTGMQRNRKADD